MNDSKSKADKDEHVDWSKEKLPGQPGVTYMDATPAQFRAAAEYCRREQAQLEMRQKTLNRMAELKDLND